MGSRGLKVLGIFKNTLGEGGKKNGKAMNFTIF